MSHPSKPWSKGRRRQLAVAGDGVGDTSLVGGWNMKPVGGVIVDESGNGNDGTIVGAITAKRTLLGDAMHCPVAGSAAYYITADGGEVGNGQFTYSCWARMYAGFSQTLWLESSSASNRPLVIFQFSWPVANALNATIRDDAGNIATATESTSGAADDGLLHHYVVVRDATDIYLYRDGVEADSASVAGIGTLTLDQRTFFTTRRIGVSTTSAHADMTAIKCYNEAKDADWVAAEYEKGARAIQGKSDYGCRVSVANETAGTLGENSSPVEISSGTWQITEDTIEGQNCKVIECIAAGVCYIPRSVFEATPTEMAYGSWEFWLYRVGGGGDNPRGSFISPDETATPAGGYRWDFSDASSLIVENGVGVTITGAAVTASVWHQIKITRASDGDFGFYADGASLGTGNDTTITTGEYMTFDMDAGDKIAYADQRGDHSLIKQLGVVAP